MPYLTHKPKAPLMGVGGGGGGGGGGLFMPGQLRATKRVKAAKGNLALGPVVRRIAKAIQELLTHLFVKLVRNRN